MALGCSSPTSPSRIDAINDLKVSHFVLPSGSWNWVVLHRLLYPHALNHFLNLLVPDFTTGLDRCIWEPDKHGEFSIKSTYTELSKNTWDAKDRRWDLIWRFKIPEHIHYFIWIVMRDRLLTNESGYHMNHTDDPSCHLCGAFTESALHILRDCALTTPLWPSLLQHQHFPDFHILGLVDWILLNIDNCQLLSGTAIPCNIFFSSLIWQIWKHRNSHIFAATTVSNADLLHVSRTWALQFHPSSLIPVSILILSQPSILRWCPAPNGWLTLNTDGSVNTISSYGSAGGLIRDNDESWLTGFNRHLDITTPLQAELWVIHEGLLLACSYLLRDIPLLIVGSIS
ncbi:hypothetical protein V6N11_060766 [Hibiscus sabdariffa]|uniref:RNase H type-1 domain-containing protein n=1 Tax=Hibiscus sabdariffa TaxID=183260 RepID=A0ABR2QRM8_9ROSI